MAVYDTLVVGGGSAGAALAARLSEDPDRRVLLLEAGPDWRPEEAPPELRLPVWGPCFDVTRVGAFHWPGITVRQTRAQPDPVPYMRGRGLGGSSVINGQVAMRPPDDYFDTWSRYGATGWDAATATRLFARIEDDLDFGDRPGHGRGGPIPVARAPRELWTPLDVALRDAAVGMGHPYAEDVHAPTAPATASWAVPSSQRDGRRVTTNDGYLAPVRHRMNLTVRGNAHVHTVLYDPAGRRAVGVVFDRGAGPETARAGEVVLCAGAFGSPAILQRSGIGPAALLESLGIEVRASLPVGEGLQDHPFVPIVLDLEKDPLQLDRPTVKCAVGYGSGLPGGAPRDMLIVAGNRVRATEDWQLPGNLQVWQQECRSRGRLAITGPGADDPLDVDLALLSDPRDLARMRDGVRRAVALAAHPAMAEVSRGASLGAAQVRGETVRSAAPDDLDDAGLDAVILANVASTSHASSTCAIGAVVDAEGRVPGVAGLRVADLSIAPAVPRANPNLTAILIGERIAAGMRG